MIDLYTWKTPNGRKISIMLEEVGLAYTVHPVDIGKNEQFDPAFLAFSPNNRIPAIIDRDGPDGNPLSVFESGAILLYLAEKTGKLLPTEIRGRVAVTEWLMWQMGGVGPMFGQAHHFRRFAPEQVPYGIERYTKEATRLYGVLDRQLAKGTGYVVGDYSIADIAIFPWTQTHEWQGVDLAHFPAVVAWRERMLARPAVIKGLAVPE
jgi:GST-like protein